MSSAAHGTAHRAAHRTAELGRVGPQHACMSLKCSGNMYVR
jgi:hypothetical protein